MKTSTRYSSVAEPLALWFPLQRNAGIISCAGEFALPSEKTSDTVPTSWILPELMTGFVELYTGLHAPCCATGSPLTRWLN